MARTDLGCQISCGKLKEGAAFKPMPFKFETVVFGEQEGENSVILVPDTEPAQPILRQSESVMLAKLTNTGEEGLTFTEWKEAGIEAGLKERTATTAIKALLQSKHAVKKDGRYLLQEEVSEEAEQLSWDDAAD